MVEALEVRQSTFLTDAPWTDSPYEITPKNPSDQLLDFLGLTSIILKRLDGLKHLRSDMYLPTALGIIDSCWKIDADLDLWYKDLEEKSPGPLYWPKFSVDEDPTSDSELGKLFPVAYHFVDVRMAHVVTLFWTTQLILVRIFLQWS
jgi:hypothetical protein